ncbi:MAG: DUF5671 domain-containing protein [Patescibacteria group bacterium]
MEQKTWSVPRNLFLHLLVIGTLYASVIGLLVLLFQYINFAFPDTLSFPYTGVLDSIRRAESILLVVFPVFLFISWLLERDFRAEPARRDSKTRKWLIYFTLFLSAITIIIDLITLIYTFLGGDLPVHFLLKILVVFAVTGIVFGYYFWELRHKASERTMLPRYAAMASAVLIIAAIGAGFFIVGSPAQQRARRFDAERIADLQMLQSGIINYWMHKEALPATTDALKDDLLGFVPERDPETGKPYEYRISGPLSFDLCAIFKTDEVSANEWMRGAKTIPVLYPDSSRISPVVSANEIWSHPAGRYCFTRAIDPDFYKPVKQAE